MYGRLCRLHRHVVVVVVVVLFLKTYVSSLQLTFADEDVQKLQWGVAASPVGEAEQRGTSEESRVDVQGRGEGLLSSGGAVAVWWVAMALDGFCEASMERCWLTNACSAQACGPARLCRQASHRIACAPHVLLPRSCSVAVLPIGAGDDDSAKFGLAMAIGDMARNFFRRGSPPSHSSVQCAL